jgi:hypothetical protein
LQEITRPRLYAANRETAMDTDRKRPWDGIISEEEQRAYRAAGFGRPGGIGSRPALLIIDVQYRTVGTTPMPFWEEIVECRPATGRRSREAMGSASGAWIKPSAWRRSAKGWSWLAKLTLAYRTAERGAASRAIAISDEPTAEGRELPDEPVDFIRFSSNPFMPPRDRTARIHRLWPLAPSGAKWLPSP